jgi:hypothetical protein
MTKKATVHKKQYELLPQEKKVRCMEIMTEQHHECLTEEEKKISIQITSVAATLYEKVDLTKPTVEFLRAHFTRIQHWNWLFLLLFNRSLCRNIQ